MNNANKITMYVHSKSVTYYDYNECLGTEHGIAWSMTGKAEDATGFERRTIEQAKAKGAEYVAAGLLEILEGEPVSRSCNMNPHGLM